MQALKDKILKIRELEGEGKGIIGKDEERNLTWFKLTVFLVFFILLCFVSLSPVFYHWLSFLCSLHWFSLSNMSLGWESREGDVSQVRGAAESGEQQSRWSAACTRWW